METTKNFETQDTAKLHFLDYWRIIRVRKAVIIAVFLLVTITTALVTFILPPTYASTARISVQRDTPDIAGVNLGQGGGETFSMYDFAFWIQTEFEKIQSKVILYQVITNLNLQTTWGEKYKLGFLPMDQTYRILKGQIDVNQTPRTSLIEIKAYSEDYNEAAAIANRITEVYRESRTNYWLEMSSKGLAALTTRLAQENLVISNLQWEVDDLKATHGISDVEVQQGFSITTVESDALRKQDAVRIEIAAEYEKLNTIYTEITNYTRAELKRAMPTIAASISQDNQLTILMNTLSSEEGKLAQLTNSLSLDHPDVKGLRANVALLNSQVDDKLEGIVRGFKVNLDAMRARVLSLTRERDEARSNDVKSAIQRRPYMQKKRELESLVLAREKLKSRIVEEEVRAAIPKSGIVQVIDRAEPEDRPVKPRKVLNILLGVIFGLALGVGVAFFIEYLDTSVKTIDDVERAMQAPVLGVIPQNVGYLIFEGPDSPHAEAYRVLRTNIMFSLKDPTRNAITAVSAGAGEGKSTTTFNLATVFAQNGARVIVVDSDLRRPSVHKILKVSNSIGLTNYLLKQNTLEEVIQTTPLATLDFLPSGKLPSSSMGVLSSGQMKELIRDLKRRYDYVFFDSPPIMGVSDASILASEVDAVMQVVQYRRYPQAMTIRAKQMIEKVGGNLLGIVLNNISMASDENYYYYSSGYYYDDKDEEGGDAKEKKGKDSDVEAKS